jgi:hypothetical protein
MKKIRKVLLILSLTLFIAYVLYLVAYLCLFDNKLIKNIFIITLPFILLIELIILLHIIKREHSKIRGFNNVIGNSFKEGIVIYDANLKSPSYASPNLEKILGVSQADVLKLNNLIFKPNVDLVKEITNFLIKRPSESDELCLNLIHQKTEKLINLNFRIIHINQAGSNVYAIVISDMTKQYNDTLILSKQVMKEQENAHKMKQILSKVSHEIRTPLNAVIGMNQMALDYLNENNPAKALECSKNVAKSGEYLYSVINNILDYTKIDNGKMFVSKESFALNEVFDEAYNILKSQIDDKKIMYRADIPTSNPKIVSDKLKITQIIINLVSNAIKYNHNEGKIDISLKYHYIDDYKIKAQIIISDDGIGMSDEFIKKLFTPFAQEHRLSTIPSTGLGLVITKGLVELLNGKITVKSRINKGTSFKIEFIFDTFSKQDLVLDNKEISLEGLRCLVAEDNQINVEICKHFLDSMKIESDVTENGELLCDKFFTTREFSYDFILMDIQMPKLNGYDATRRIRKSLRDDRAIPIIAFTADAFDDDVKQAILSGMDGHVSKPVSKESLKEAIVNAILKCSYKK